MAAILSVVRSSDRFFSGLFVSAPLPEKRAKETIDSFLKFFQEMGPQVENGARFQKLP